MREDNDSNKGYDYKAYMDYMYLDVQCPRKSDKNLITHSLYHLDSWTKTHKK